MNYFSQRLWMSAMWQIFSKIKEKKQDFDSYRGVFRTPVLQNILDKLIYNEEYENIDKIWPTVTLDQENVGISETIFL